MIKAAKIIYPQKEKPMGKRYNSWIILIEGIERHTGMEARLEKNSSLSGNHGFFHTQI